MTWHLAAAAVAGPHKQPEQGQDAVRTRLIRAQDQEILVLALADGAGSAQHARAAAQLIVKSLAAFTAERIRGRLRRGPQKTLWQEADTRAAMTYTRRQLHAEIQAQGHDRREWGSTALLAVLTADSTTLGQVGDGAMCVRQAGQWLLPLPVNLDAYVNVTPMLVDADAPVQVAQLAAVEAIVGFSDGLQPLAIDYATGQPFAPFCDGVIRALDQALGRTLLEQHLRQWLASPTVRARTDDDVSLLLASRQG